MNKAESNLGFNLMALSYKLRDALKPRKDILKETGIRTGDFVLDYGCGPGSYILPLAELIGKNGRIYAVDIHPLAIRRVRNISLKNRLANVEVFCSDCKTNISDGSIDVILLYDVLHNLSNLKDVLKEFHRVLKRKGFLSISDHHMEEKEIVSAVTRNGLFLLGEKGTKTYSFLKQ